MTKQRIAALAQQVATLTLAHLQQGEFAAAPTLAPKAPKAPKATKAEQARKAAREAKQAAGLAKVRGIAQAKATKGKVQLVGAQVTLAQLVGIDVPEGCTRFTLSIADKGWAFVHAGGTTRMQEVPVLAAQAAELRTLVPATLK